VNTGIQPSTVIDEREKARLAMSFVVFGGRMENDDKQKKKQ